MIRLKFAITQGTPITLDGSSEIAHFAHGDMLGACGASVYYKRLGRKGNYQEESLQ